VQTPAIGKRVSHAIASAVQLISKNNACLEELMSRDIVMRTVRSKMSLHHRIGGSRELKEVLIITVQ